MDYYLLNCVTLVRALGQRCWTFARVNYLYRAIYFTFNCSVPSDVLSCMVECDLSIGRKALSNSTVLYGIVSHIMLILLIDRGRQHSCCLSVALFKVLFLLFLCYFNSCHSVFCTPSQDTG